MPKIKASGAFDSVLNEYVYTALYKADYEQKRGLKGKYLKAATSEKAARNFSENGSREEKEYVLAHLGYDFCYVINQGGKGAKHLKQFLPILSSGKKSQANKAIAENGLFITSDRDILRAAGLVSRHIHHPSYYMDLEILRQGYHVAKWTKKYGGAKDFAFREADESARIINKTLVNAILNAEYATGLIGIPKNQISILQYLYSVAGDVTEEKLKAFFIGRMSNIEYKNSIRALYDAGLVGRITGLFMITGSGIKKVNDFFHSVIHSNNF